MKQGGVQIEANTLPEVDNVCAALGIVCPHCAEALYLRSAYNYNYNNKEIVVPKTFVHYSIKDELGLKAGEVCERRSLSPAGREDIKRCQQRLAAQRLEIFNNNFWDIVTQDIKEIAKLNPEAIDDKKCKEQIVKYLGGRYIDDQAKIMREIWRDKAKIKKTMADAVTEGTTTVDTFVSCTGASLPETTKSYLRNLDIESHKAICMEVIDFLGTKTAKYIWEKAAVRSIMSVAVWQAASPKFQELTNFLSMEQIGTLIFKQLKENNYSVQYVRSLIITIAVTPWLLRIKERMDVIKSSHLA